MAGRRRRARLVRRRSARQLYASRRPRRLPRHGALLLGRVSGTASQVPLVLRSAEGASRRTALRSTRQTAPELKAFGLDYRVCDKLQRDRLLDGASIYILRCADGSYYTGVTRRSVDERVSEHALGLDDGCYTFRRRPVTLVHAEHYSRIVDAVAAERRIKGWSRAKKEAYIRGDYAALVALAKRSGKRALRDG